jgi:NADPH:quinone reductase-like Zn-dependent oxidoreductase
VAVTAWQALFDEAHLSRGQKVLIHGAAGNVGSYAVQLAHQAGLQVVATAQSDDMTHVRLLGADMVVDFRTDRFEDKVRDVDAVIDLVGGDVQERSFGVLKSNGVLVSAVSKPDQALAKRHAVSAHFFLVGVTTERLDRIADMISRGGLRSVPVTVMPLASVRQVHEILDGSRPRPKGKIVLQMER